MDDKKITDWNTVAGIYFPLETFQSAKNNILTKSELVNSSDGNTKSNQSEKSMNIEELNNALKDALKKTSEPLRTVPFTRDNFNKLFPYSKIETPVETVKLGEHQFEKLDAKARDRFLLASYQTLVSPSIVISEERDGKKSHNYVKSFVFDEKTKAVQNIVVSIDGENVSISTHPREINNLVNKIKTPDQLVYAAAEVGRLIERMAENQSVTVNPTRGMELSTLTNPLNKAYDKDIALSTLNLIKSQPNLFSRNLIDRENRKEEWRASHGKSLPTDSRKPQKNEKSAQSQKVSPQEHLKRSSEQFLKHLEQGKLPFMRGEEVGDDILIKVKAVRNGMTGRPLTGFQQLLAQDAIQTLVDGGKLPRMEYELVTYEQAKETGTFIKKGSPHITIPVYNEKTNKVFTQMYYFKSGCHEPDKIDLANLKVQRENFIKRERAKLEKAMKEREVPLEERNKIYESIAANHQSIITYMKARNQDVEAYKASLPKEEQDALKRLEEKKPAKEMTMEELLQRNKEYRNRVVAEDAKRQQENPSYFNARESASYEDYLGKVMAAASLGGAVVATKSAINSVTTTLAPVLRQSHEQFDYMKGYAIGEVANEKCKENLREMRSNSRENQEMKQTMEKTLAFQSGGRMNPPNRNGKEIEGFEIGA